MRPLLEELEPRILHSADAAVLVPAAPLVQLVEMRVVETPPAEVNAAAAEQVAQTPREIVIVDSAVEGYQALVDDLEASRKAGRDVYVLDASADGVAQISGILATQHDLQAVHLVSHGGEGALRIGASVLDRASLERNAGLIAGWARALTPDADLLIYGCDVAAGEAGRAFVDRLAAMTGADVAASADLTGSAAKGGDWTLEYAAGRIDEAALAGSAWNGLLAGDEPPTVTEHALAFDGTDVVVAPSSASLTMSSTMTMEAAIRRTGPLGASNQIILNKEGEYEMAVSPTGELLYAFAGTTPGWAWVSTGYVVPADAWVHVAVTYNDGTVNTYVDGELVDTHAGTGPIGDVTPAMNHLTIGSRENANDQFFVGLIDEVRVWNVERSAAEILSTYRTPLAGNEAGLAAYWRFDEASGTTAVDSTANGNNGVLGNGVAADVPARTTNLDYTVAEDTPLVVAAPGVLQSATDAEGLPVTAILVTGPAHAASFTLNADGSFSYTAAADYVGADLFTFKATDGTVESGDVTVRIGVTAVNDAPVRTAGAVNDLTVLEDATATSLGLGALAYGAGGGADEGAQTLTYTVTAIPAAALGTVTLADGTTAVTASTSYSLAQLQGMQFTAAANASGGPATFSWSVVDNAGGADTLLESLTISVTAVNDAPAGANKTVTTLEDTAYTATLADFGFSDAADSPANALSAVRIATLPGAGTLTLAGVGVSAGQSITRASVLAGDLKFNPAADANGAGHASFTFQVQDDGGVANGGVDLDPTPRTMTIDVTAVNDAPVLSGTNDLGGINRNPTSNPGTLVADLLSGHFSDADSADLAGIAVIAVDNTNGAWEYSTNGGSTWTAFGSPSAGAARLLAADVSTYVRFVPNTNFSGVVANGLTFKAWDQTSGVAATIADATVGGVATAFSAASASASITVTATNTAPTLTGSNNLTAINEDATGNAGTLVSSLIATMTSDADPGALAGIAVTAVDNTNGAWQYSVNGGTNWTAFGAPSATSARLLAADANTFVRLVPNANFNGTVSNGITFHAWDRSTGVNGGTADTSGLAGTFRDDFSTASYANNNGTLTWAGPWVETDSQGGGAASGRFQIANGALAIQVANVGDNIYREANLSGATGATLSFSYLSGLKNSAELHVQVSNDGGATYTTPPNGVFDSVKHTFAGTVTIDISASISANTRIRWFVVDGESASDKNQFYLGNLQITASGNSGGSTAFSTATASASVTVNAVNDAPVRTAGTVNNLTVLEDAPVTSLGLGTLAYSVGGGADEAVQTLTYTVTAVPAAALGAVTLADGTTVVTASTGYSLAQLQGMQFKAAANASGGPATFSWTVADSGGTANGGVDTLAQSLTITVTSVNDAPMGNNRTVTMLEDTTYIIPLTDFGYTDGSDTPPNMLLNVKIGTIPAAGSLTLSGAAVTAGQSISGASINAGNLRFTPAANTNGTSYANFTFRVQDDGGVANGGVDTDTAARTFTFDVTPVSDAPAGTSKTVTTLEDTTYTFAVADFGFSDAADGNALLGVKIASLPGAGSLTLSGIAVTANQTVSAAAITAGNLKFTPAANANGAAYASFTFQVQDNGGVANGGADLDPTARTMTVAVTPVNDAPAGANKTVTTLEDVAYTFGAADFGFSDALDGNALASVKIASVPTAGSLTLSGVAVTAGQSVSAASIGAGSLKFTPAGDANGAAYASFTFQVQDNGGVANGGADTDPTPRTMTIDVTSVNDAPAGANKTVTTLEDIAYTFTAADFGFADPKDGNAFTGVKIASLPAAGALTLAGAAVSANQTVTAASITAGDLKFAPAADANGAAYASFTFQVQDSGGTANGGADLDPIARTMTVDVVSVNDAPAGANKTVTTLEDVAYTFGAADFGFSDALDGNALASVKIASVPTAGSLTLSGVAVSAGQSVSAASIGAGSLKFTPAADANGAAYASFTFQVQDNGGVANGGADTDPTPRTMTIDVTSVNDAPAGANKTVTTLEDTAYTFSAADFGFADPKDGNAFTGVRIASLPAAGALTLGGVAVSANQAVTAASIAAGDLKFAPAADANGGAYASFTFQVQDSGGTANGGADLDPIARTMTIDVTAVNDAPAGTSTTVTAREDTPYIFALADFGFSDPRDGNALASVTIATLPAAGTLTLSGVAVNAGQVVTAASVAAGDLRFAAAADANGAAYASFSFQVQDSGGTANGGVDLDPTPRTMTIDVAAVNDPPAGVNNTVTTLEDTAYVFAMADFGFADAIEGNGVLAVKIASLPANGTLTLNGVALGANQSVLAMSIAAGDLRFAPAANANGAGYASFTFQVQDDGGTANGGVDLDPIARTMTIDVIAVSDAPAGASNTITTLEDTPYTFAVSDFGFTDAADANALSSVKIASLPAAGALTLGGVAVAADQFVTVASIAAGDLKFTPAADANGAAYSSFTFQVQDDGGTANGGADLDPVARTMTIGVTPVNDAPAGTSATVTTLEDTPYTFSAADFGFTDAADTPNALLAVRIGAVPTTGTLAYDFVPVAAGQVVTAADLAAGKLMFIPALDGNASPYASFTFQVQDDGGTANGGADLDPVARTMTVAVTPVNDAPAGTSNAVATLEDTPYVFTAADFGFSDVGDANALMDVKIASLPAAGTLTLSGVAVSANQFVSAAQIAAGDFRFAPAADANGAAYASFTFQVRDDGGTANGGVDLDPVARTMAIAVTPVNDAPTGTDRTVATLEDTAYTFTTADFGFSDTRDGNALSAVKIASVPGAGSLTLAGVAVVAGQSVSAASIAAGDLRFTPGANDNGAAYAAFAFQVQDDGGTANGGVDTDTVARTLTIAVAPVNDAPRGADGTVTTLEGVEYTFAPGDFGFSDSTDTPANALATVKIAAVSGAGTLALNGATVTPGQVITAARIAAGELKIAPGASGSGAAYAIVTFQVQDDGGTASGGADTDPTVRTLTVDVLRKPVDAPVADVPALPPSPPPTQSAQTEEAAAGSPADPRSKASLARIAAELGAAITRTQGAPLVDTTAEVLPPPATPELRNDAAASTAPASSASARRDSATAAAVVAPVLFEMRPDAAPPAPIAFSLSSGGRAATAAAAPDAADSSAEQDDAKHQAYALLTLENGVRASAIIVSAGMVTWTLHGAGLIASLLTSAPAWRHLDPLPVLAPETEKPDWGENDGDAQREEDAADRLWLGSSSGTGRTL